MTRRVVEKLCTKKVCVDFLAPRNVAHSRGWVTRDRPSPKFRGEESQLMSLP